MPDAQPDGQGSSSVNTENENRQFRDVFLIVVVFMVLNTQWQTMYCTVTVQETFGVRYNSLMTNHVLHCYCTGDVWC